MIESILKKESEKINLSQSINLSNIINIDNITKHDFNKSTLKINGFSLEKKEKYFLLNKGRFFRENNFYDIYNKAKEYNNILLKYKKIFLSLKNDNKIVTSSINELTIYLYYDLIINLEIAAYKHKLDIDNNKEKLFIDKILGKKLEYSDKTIKSKKSEYKKSTLIQRSTTAKYWSRTYHTKSLEYKIANISKKINPIELEFPLKYEQKKVLNLLNDFSSVLEFLKIDNRDFEIRFKKLGLYKKEGMYLKKSKTLIIDPRHSRTIFHELGHFIYETDTPFYIDGKKITKRSRNKIIKDNKDKYQSLFKNHRIEELDVNSETFSYWFEDYIKYDILNKINKF
jgi:hypothetical protein